MGYAKQELIGRQFINEFGYNKNFYELSDEETFEVLREQNELFKEPEKPVIKKDFKCYCQAPKWSWSKEKEDKLRNNSK